MAMEGWMFLGRDLARHEALSKYVAVGGTASFVRVRVEAEVWQSLCADAPLRQGNLIRFRRAVSSAKAGPINLTAEDGAIAAATHVDSDGDCSVALLEDMRVEGLHSPTRLLLFRRTDMVRFVSCSTSF